MSYIIAWSLATVCYFPLFAHIASWLSPLVFAVLGIVWALQAEGHAARTRFVPAISPIVIDYLAVLDVLSFDLACASNDSVTTRTDASLCRKAQRGVV